MAKDLPGETALDQKKRTEGDVEKTSTEQPAASEADKEEREMKYTAYYYWPILPQEHYKRWEIENATMWERVEGIMGRIPPPPPDLTPQERLKTVRKNLSLWALFKKSNR